MSDVLLTSTPDGGNICLTEGDVTLTGGFETAVYLCLFGGNSDDSTRPQDPLTWWGNIDENDPSRQYRSKTQYLLSRLPATSFNLIRIQRAVLFDLEVFTRENIASNVEAAVTMPAVNAVNIQGAIQAQGVETSFNFTENWRASR